MPSSSPPHPSPSLSSPSSSSPPPSSSSPSLLPFSPEMKFLDHECFTKVFSKPNHTSPGPNGFPFSFYNTTFPILKNLYFALALDITSDNPKAPLYFGDSNLHLIPKGELTIEPEVRNWVEFYRGFKNTMKTNDKSDVESLSYLRLAIHHDLQSQL